MPGLFGGVGCAPELLDSLRREFSAPWGSCESTTFSSGILGGHSFQSAPALNRRRNKTYFAVDGEASLYRAAQQFALEDRPALFQEFPGSFVLTSVCRGNLAAVSPDEEEWHLAADWAGSFPLFYSQAQGGLLFCNRLKPLARVLHSSPDLTAIREYFHDNYLLNRRSFFNGIHLLMPGQVLHYKPSSDRLQLSETSRIWVGVDEGPSVDRKSAAGTGWKMLVDSLMDSQDRNQQHALMMSGGWDSRTLIAALKRCLPEDRFIGYSHGDVLSRELRLTERICKSSGVRFHREPIDNAVMDPDLLRWGFDRVETAVFPEWHRAGHALAELGVKSAVAGVLGEVLGGHYGHAILTSGLRKISTLTGQLLGWPGSLGTSSLADVHEFLRVKSMGRPWHVLEAFWDGANFLDVINADIETDLTRLEDRGVATGSQLIEAFITEHRGVQYINSQLLSCRTSVDVSIPFGDRDFLTWASRIPLTTKVHNSLNQEMLEQEDAGLLRFSTAATLVPAGWPILAQEGSRIIRSYVENVQWKLHSSSAGRIRSPHMGWWYWEFLRDGVVLNTIVDSLRCDFWNRSAMRERIRNLIKPGAGSPGMLMQVLLRDYNVDLLLRSY